MNYNVTLVLEDETTKRITVAANNKRQAKKQAEIITACDPRRIVHSDVTSSKAIYFHCAICNTIATHPTTCPNCKSTGLGVVHEADEECHQAQFRSFVSHVSLPPLRNAEEEEEIEQPNRIQPQADEMQSPDTYVVDGDLMALESAENEGMYYRG